MIRRQLPSFAPARRSLLIVALAALTCSLAIAESRAAELVFASNSMAIGSAAMGSGSRRSSVNLNGQSHYGTTLAKVTAPNLSLAEANAIVTSYRSTPRIIDIEMKSSANPGGVYANAQGQAHTGTVNNGGPGYITINVRATKSGENGKRVLVSLRQFMQSTAYGSTSSSASNYYAVITPAGSFNGTAYGSSTRQSSTSFYATVGGSFSVHVMAYSYSLKNTGSRACTSKVTISIPN